MKEHVWIDKEDWKNQLDFIADKVEDVYRREVDKLVREMKQELDDAHSKT